MRSFTILALAAVVPAFVSAANFTVNVGANGMLAYDPPSMNASVGDMVSFVFHAKNHSVVSSTFANPCTSSGTFNSGFMPVMANSTGPFPAFIINVTSTAPIWFYCAQTSPVDHCRSGMVGAINPTANKTFAAFQASAMGNSTTNSTTTTNSTSAGNMTSSATGSSAPAATSNGAGAIRVGSGGVALLSLVGVVAGLSAL